MKEQMVSKDCLITEFLASCKGMDRLSASLHARRELDLLEQAISTRQFYRRESETHQYNEELGEFIFYMENGIRPASATLEHWQQYQEIGRFLASPALNKTTDT